MSPVPPARPGKPRRGGGASSGSVAPRPSAAWTRLWVLALILMLAAAFAWNEDYSMDVGTHLAAGRFMLQHHAWPTTDPFTYSVSGHRYVDLEWLFQLPLAILYGWAGFKAVALVRLTLILLTALLLWTHTMRRGVWRPALLCAGFTLAILVWEMRFFIRPELVTYGFLALELLLLRRHGEDGKRKWLYWLVPVQVVWVNCHPLAFLGPVLIGLYALSGARRDPTPWIVAGLAVLGLLLNPYGVEGLRSMWELRSRLERGNLFAQSIPELASPFSRDIPRILPILAFKVYFGLAVALVLVELRRIRLFDLGMLALLGALAWLAARNTGLFVVGSLPVLLETGQRVADRVGRFIERRRALAPLMRPRVAAVPLAGSSLVTLLLVASVVGGGYYNFDLRPTRFGWRESRACYPVHSVDYIQQHQLHGPIFNSSGLGTYLLWRLWPKEKVFVLPQLEIMGESFYQSYERILAGDGWPEAERRYGFRLVLVNYTAAPLLRLLESDPRWALLDADATGVLFARVEPGTRGLADEAARAWRRLGEEGRAAPPLEPPVLATRRHFALVSPPIPWESWGRGDAFLNLRRHDVARTELRRSLLASDGELPGMATSYASACFHLGFLDEARAWYQEGLREDPGDPVARQRLQLLLAPAPGNAGSSSAP